MKREEILESLISPVSLVRHAEAREFLWSRAPHGCKISWDLRVLAQ